MFPRNHGDNLWRFPLYIPQNMVDKSGDSMPLSVIRKIDMQVKEAVSNNEDLDCVALFKELAEKEGYYEITTTGSEKEA